MLSNLRTIAYFIFACCILAFTACGKDKTAQPAVNRAPAVPSNPSPAYDATGIEAGSLILSWHGSDPDGDSVRYDVYIDTLPNLVLISPSQLDTTYQIGGVEVSRDYYWKVVARDEHGSETASPIWHFTTQPGQEQIAFVAGWNSIGAIYVMNIDGSNIHIISDTLDIGDFSPSYSNDGAKIAFGHSDNEIYTMNHDGTGRFQVTHLIGGRASLPVWSPDGSKIAYVYDGGNENYYGAIWVVDANGANPHAVTGPLMPNWVCEEISWSPQGEIAFEHDTLGGGGCAIFAVNSDGTNMRKLTDYSSEDTDPAWSHDGTRIAFARYVRSESTGVFQIYVMNADGTDQHNIQNTQANGGGPCWSPDDSRIAFNTSSSGSDAGIWLMNADGSNQHAISVAMNGTSPSWGPWHR